MMEPTLWFWVVFNAAVLGLLLLDLGVFSKKDAKGDPAPVPVRTALLKSGAYVALALGFFAFLWTSYGPEADRQTRALEFLTGMERRLPVTEGYRGNRFTAREAGRWMLTPLALVLILVELTDLVFALDSIPAIFAVTTDPFIVYTANVFAILGLRTMYFLLAGIIHRFHYLKHGLSVVLMIVGA